MALFDFLKKKELQEIERLKSENLDLANKLSESNAKMSNHEKGKAFEDYVENVMFPDFYYSVVRKTPSYNDLQERRREDFLLPDFTFRRTSNNFIFNVEAKFRSLSNLTHDCNFNFCTPEQYYRYCRYDDKPTFIALGLGTNPANPEIVTLFPVNAVPSNQVFLPELLRVFWFYKDRRVYYKHLYKLLNNSVWTRQGSY